MFEGFATSGTITLNAGELQITDSVDIVGPGAADLTISGNDQSSVFLFGDESGASTFNVSGLTLTDGNGQNDAGIGTRGGAVLFFDSLESGGADTLNISDSIISNNSGSPNFGVLSDGQNLFVSGGHNIFDDGSGNLPQAGDQPNTDPLLLPLGDNGGQALTHALRLESPAIDAVSNALAIDGDGNPLATDQRGAGFDRVLDGTVDVGSFESELFQGDLVVSTDTDIVDNDFSSGELSLREAVLIANERTGVNTITFDAALNGQTITLTDDALTGELQVTESIDIVGPGAADLTIIDSTIDGNSANGNGGGIHNFTNSSLAEANLAIFGTSISDNDTIGGLAGGGIASVAGVVTKPFGSAGDHRRVRCRSCQRLPKVGWLG